jgi:hypothetical protein
MSAEPSVGRTRSRTRGHKTGHANVHLFVWSQPDHAILWLASGERCGRQRSTRLSCSAQPCRRRCIDRSCPRSCSTLLPPTGSPGRPDRQFDRADRMRGDEHRHRSWTPPAKSVSCPASAARGIGVQVLRISLASPSFRRSIRYALRPRCADGPGRVRRATRQ